MHRGDKELLQDIQEAINRIQNYIDGIEYSNFLEDTKTQDSVIRNFEIIGEAAKRISSQIKKSCPDVEWTRDY